MQEGTEVGTVLNKESLLRLEESFLSWRFGLFELVVNIAGEQNSWKRLIKLQILRAIYWSFTFFDQIEFEIRHQYFYQISQEKIRKIIFEHYNFLPLFE